LTTANAPLAAALERISGADSRVLRADEAAATPKALPAAKKFSARWKLFGVCDEALADGRSARAALFANAVKPSRMACEKCPIHRHFCDFVVCLMKMPMLWRFS
jgi:anti-sigma factor ChrR (cupin superfamily)